MIEDLSVVGTLYQSVKPHADRLVSVSFADVELGQSVSQRARLRTKLQQRLTQSDALIKPSETHRDNSFHLLQNLLQTQKSLESDLQ